MQKATSQLAYQAASAGGASQIGLLVLVYSAVATDLWVAGDSVECGGIAARCAASNHALALLSHLESWKLDCDSELSSSLTDLYGYLRRQIVGLQGGGSDQDFYQLAELVLSVRATWQEKEQQLIFQQQNTRETEVLPPSLEEVVAAGPMTHGWCA